MTGTTRNRESQVTHNTSHSYPHTNWYTDNCGWYYVEKTVKTWFSGKLRHYWITLGEDWITTGLDLGRNGSLLDYMHSGPTGATYLPDLYRLPYPVEDLD